jgi:hypothetical protein
MLEETARKIYTVIEFNFRHYSYFVDYTSRVQKYVRQFINVYSRTKVERSGLMAMISVCLSSLESLGLIPPGGHEHNSSYDTSTSLQSGTNILKAFTIKLE